MHVFGTLSTRGMSYTHAPHTEHGANTFLVAIYTLVKHNTLLYFYIVHTMNWTCQNTSDTSAKTTEKHKKMLKIPWKMRKYTGAPESKTRFLTSLSCSVCFFFWSIFRNFRVIGGDTEHERIFLGRQPRVCGWRVSEKQKKKPALILKYISTTQFCNMLSA